MFEGTSILLITHQTLHRRWRNKQRMPVGGSLGLKLILPEHVTVILANKGSVFLLFVLCAGQVVEIISFQEKNAEHILPPPSRDEQKIKCSIANNVINMALIFLSAEF